MATGSTRSVAIPAAMSKFKIILPWQVPWGDMDAMRHVNNCMYLKYFEHSRVLYFEELGISFAAPTSRKASNVSHSESGIVSSVTCKFRRPLTYPDNILVGTRVRSVDANRGDFLLEHAIWSVEQSLIAATGTSGCVCYDYVAQKRIPMPPGWLTRLKEIEQTTDDFPLFERDPGAI